MSKSTLGHKVPLIIFILLSLLLLWGLFVHNARDLPSTLIGKTAPSFELSDLLYESGESNLSPQKVFKPDQLLGQRWILNVWASWCVGCRVEHPLLNQLAQHTKITLVGLNYKDKPEDAKRWLEQRGNPYRYIPTDINGDVGIDYGVYGVPETFVIDEQGAIVFKHTGPLTVPVIEKDILPLFSKHAPNLSSLNNEGH